MRPMIEGYEAEIHRGLWERILVFGGPRLWSTIWLVLNAYAALLLLFILGAKGLAVPGVCWPAGQAWLLWQTRRDVQWDDVLFASPKYGNHYEVG